MDELAARMEQALDATVADLLAYLVRRVADPQDAADLLGETLLQAWRRVDALPDAEERRRMWLFTIARHVLANHRRSLGRRNALVTRLRGALATVPRANDQDDVGARLAVRDVVRRLPDAQRELVMLVHWDGFSLTEAAELLGVSASTARSRYASARARLKRDLSDEGSVTPLRAASTMSP